MRKLSARLFFFQLSDTAPFRVLDLIAFVHSQIDLLIIDEERS